MNLIQLLESFKTDRAIAPNIAKWQVFPPRAGVYEDYPDYLDEKLVSVMKRRGIQKLYSHQREAVDSIHAGHNTVIVTPTASGKTLCYNLPVLDSIMKNHSDRAMYLFPTKALSQDQLAELTGLIDTLDVDIKTYTFDGDTPQTARRLIRSAGHIVVTNPDMLHAGILPHHTKWIKLFENLKFVVIDEIHHYRGIFGSHLANVVRRLRRVCNFYGSDPIFICSSATIANPAELAERITGKKVNLVDKNGAPTGEKHFIIYNPPVINKQLGIRKSALGESFNLAERFIRERIQTIVFAQYRLQVEVLLSYLREKFKEPFGKNIKVAGYRGGYLPNQRRDIEQGLRSGAITGVVSTNALELGIDIGALDVSIICGYPGSISSVWQQAGRAGRRADVSVTIFVANSSAINQFLAKDPTYLFKKTPEMGIIDPDNLIISANHIKCASFELPLSVGEKFRHDGTEEILDYLESQKVVRQAGGKYHWASEIYPAQQVSLRSASPENFVILNQTDNNRVIGEVDYYSAPIFLHPEAIYLHDADQYQVTELDWEGRKAYVKETDVDYYTDAETKTDLKVLSVTDEKAKYEARLSWGEVTVTSVTVLYKKIKFHTHENVGWGKIELPELELHTNSYWYSFPGDIRFKINLDGEQFGGALRGVANILGKIAPLWMMCDPHDLRSISQVRSPFTELPTIYIYENIPDGVGYSEKLFNISDDLFRACLDQVENCPCQSGCPSCVGPEMEVGESGKSGTVKLLKWMLGMGV
ncbi:MAG: ATP-dependent helicase [candidate division Zixibacteria bacterium HGW-Zixibacteria-1]|nr:MAG: ATP-dependent helicase [candidate division Zixibacteria bacterium HGW-Zixibacteria-1]